MSAHTWADLLAAPVRRVVKVAHRRCAQCEVVGWGREMVRDRTTRSVLLVLITVADQGIRVYLAGACL